MENQYLPNYIAEMQSTVPGTDRKLPEVNNSCMTCDCGCTFYLFSLDVLFYWVFAVYIGSLDVPLFEISFCFWNVLDYIISFEPLWGAHGSCVSGFLNCFTLLSKTVVWRSIPNFLGPSIKSLTFLWVNLCPCFSTKSYLILEIEFQIQNMLQEATAFSSAWIVSLFCVLQKENDILAIWLHAGPHGAMCGIWLASVTLLLGIPFLFHEMPVSLTS